MSELETNSSAQKSEGSIVGSSADSKATTVGIGPRIAYGIGGLTAFFGAVGVKSLAFPVYNMTLKVDPALLGLLLALPRFWDAITDPAMGYLSDRTNSRFGRRRPYIVVGAVLTAIAFVSIWMVPEQWPQSGQLAWFMVTSLIFYTCLTVWAVPYQSLGYEITANYHERTAVMSVTSFFMKCGELLSQWIFPLAQLAIFASVLQGVRMVTIGIAVLFFAIAGMIPGFFVKERFSGQAAQAIKKKKTPPKFWRSCRDVIVNRGVAILVTLTLLKITAGLFSSALDYYLIVYYMFDGDIAEGSIWKGVLTTGYGLVGFASIPIIAYCSRRFDKKRTLAGIYVLLVIGGIAKWFLFQPGNSWILLLDALLCGPNFVAVGMLMPSMAADICDEDEWQYGKRREGIIASLMSWIQKTGASLAFFGGGLALNWVGFDAALGGDQSPGAILGIRVLFCLSTVILSAIAVVVLFFYPLNEKRVLEIRSDLEGRRGVR